MKKLIYISLILLTSCNPLIVLTLQDIIGINFVGLVMGLLFFIFLSIQIKRFIDYIKSFLIK